MLQAIFLQYYEKIIIPTTIIRPFFVLHAKFAKNTIPPFPKNAGPPAIMRVKRTCSITIYMMISPDIRSDLQKLLPSSLDKPQALSTKASRDGRSHFNTSLSPPFFRKQSPAAGGLTGGQWEVLAKHLPSHFPFIHRPFTPLTGGREVFYKNVFLTTSIFACIH